MDGDNTPPASDRSPRARLKAIGDGVVAAIAPAYSQTNMPSKVLPGSGGPDHPGIVVISDDGPTSHNWVGGGSDGQPNYYQLVTVDHNHRGSLIPLRQQITMRDTYEVTMHYNKDRGYSGSIRQVAESDNGDPSGIGILSRSDARFWTDDQKRTHTQLTSFEGAVSLPDAKGRMVETHVQISLGRGDLNHPDGGILFLERADANSLNPHDRALKEAVEHAELNASHSVDIIQNNLTDKQGGPPLNGINPDYRSAMILPQDFGGYIAAQVGPSTSRVTPYAVIGMSGAGGSFNEYGHYEGVGKVLRAFGINVPPALETQSMTQSGPNGTETYDPRLKQSQSFSGARSERTFPGEQRSVPGDMQGNSTNAQAVLKNSAPLMFKWGEGLGASFVKADGRPDCPPESWDFRTGKPKAGNASQNRSPQRVTTPGAP